LAKARASYFDFSKVCEKKKIKKKNTKNIGQTLKARISVMVMRIRLKFGKECVLGLSKAKMVQFKLQMRKNGVFLVPV